VRKGRFRVGASIGLDPHFLGTHSLRRTKATLIYRRTGNLRAVQLLLGHRKIESAVRYLGIDRIQAQLRTGKGILKVARECGVGSGTVQRIKQEMTGPFVGVAA
jgi:integrase